MMGRRERVIARASLVAVWLWTAFVSIQQLDGMSRALLAANAGIPSAWHPWIIWSGAGVDLALGVLMAALHRRAVYLAALAMTLVMTVVGTAVDPTLWLHPLGPMSKNLPILALLWLLARDAGQGRP